MLPRPHSSTVPGTSLLARALLCVAGSAALSAALSAADPPPVPDPLGLGERLALIDCLQQTYHVTPPIGESLDQLRTRYAAAWTLAQAQTPEHRDADSKQQREDRLRRLIATRFHQEAAPALDEEGLLTELHRLEALQQDADQVALAKLAASPGAGAPATGGAPGSGGAHGAGSAPGAGGPPTRPPAAAPFATPPARPPAGASSAAAAGIDLHLTPAMEELRDCWYKQAGDHAILIVSIGADWNGAFKGAPEHIWDAFRRAKEIHRAVAILGHGNGSGIAGMSIMDHLKKYQAFYETMGGQQPQERIGCLLFASCSIFSAEQMGEMRNGLGYYPTWRVAAGARVTMNLPVFLGALRGIMDLPAAPAFRGVYRFGNNVDFSGAVGEVGADGERGTPVNFWVDGSGAVIPGL